MSKNLITGTPGDDKGVNKLVGTGMDDLIIGLAGEDEIEGLEGHDDLYGDVTDYELSVVASPNMSVFAGSFTVTYDDDIITAGNGDDLAVGDVGIHHVKAIASIANTANADAFISSVSFVMGDDYIYGEQGNDSLYGDILTMSTLAQSGTSSNSHSSFVFVSTAAVMGDDTLEGGEGNDLIVGDVGSIRLEGLGGSTSSGSSTILLSVTNTFGNDILRGGNGIDALFGDVQYLEIVAVAGEANTAGEAEAFVDPHDTFGNDLLEGDNGDDHLVGDVGQIDISIEGGLANTSNLFSSTSAASGPGLLFGLGQTFLSFGNDNLDNDGGLFGGNGNDHLVGDVQYINISLIGGTNTGTSTSFLTAGPQIVLAIYAMGDDYLDGGSGNDWIYGDVEAFNVTSITGTGVGTTPIVDGTTLQFGDDILIGGMGDDHLYGDEAVSGELHILLQGFLFNTVPGTDIDPRFPPNGFGNTVTYGDDLLEGGQGNDFLTGDTLDLGDYDMDTPARVQNTLKWGDDTLTGGDNVDTFAFLVVDMDADDVMEMQGDDTITDLEFGETLQFLGVLDVNGGGIDASDLDDQTTFSDVNAGTDLEIVFDGGGSITLEGYGGLGITSFDDGANSLTSVGIVIDVSG